MTPLFVVVFGVEVEDAHVGDHALGGPSTAFAIGDALHVASAGESTLAHTLETVTLDIFATGGGEEVGVHLATTALHTGAVGAAGGRGVVVAAASGGDGGHCIKNGGV